MTDVMEKDFAPEDGVSFDVTELVEVLNEVAGSHDVPFVPLWVKVDGHIHDVIGVKAGRDTDGDLEVFLELGCLINTDAAPASAAEPVGWQVQFDDGNWSNALYSEAEVKEFKASPRGTVAAYRPVYDHPPVTIDT